MKRYHITVLGYYNNSDSTHQTTIECDGMYCSNAGLYEFYNKTTQSNVVVAYYPIRQTIITNIETIKK
jgi:hypothetical protein